MSSDRLLDAVATIESVSVDVQDALMRLPKSLPYVCEAPEIFMRVAKALDEARKALLEYETTANLMAMAEREYHREPL